MTSIFLTFCGVFFAVEISEIVSFFSSTCTGCCLASFSLPIERKTVGKIYKVKPKTANIIATIMPPKATLNKLLNNATKK